MRKGGVLFHHAYCSRWTIARDERRRRGGEQAWHYGENESEFSSTIPQHSGYKSLGSLALEKSIKLFRDKCTEEKYTRSPVGMTLFAPLCAYQRRFPPSAHLYCRGAGDCFISRQLDEAIAPSARALSTSVPLRTPESKSIGMLAPVGRERTACNVLSGGWESILAAGLSPGCSVDACALSEGVVVRSTE